MGALRNLKRILQGRRKKAKIVRALSSHDYLGRYREIVSDPLNLLIERHPKAGWIEGGLVYLHNGLRVPSSGDEAYYGTFSDILVVNRGVHEPLEEYVFQTLLRHVRQTPTMIELGAYWGHYSMWLKQARPAATVILVEPDPKNLAVGRSNFRINGMDGEFINAFVGENQFTIDGFFASRGIDHLDILHSDIQGFEDQMLRSAASALGGHRIDYIFISTHGGDKHRGVVEALQQHGYRIEVASDCAAETTSFDGLVFATSARTAPLFENFTVFGSDRIREETPADILAWLTERRTLDSGGGGRIVP